jgi:hypothetical protein
MTNYTSKRPLALALAMSAALVGGAAVADGHAIDLEGKTVEWIIPFSETGGSAKWANFYAPLLAEALQATRLLWSCLIQVRVPPKARTTFRK